MSDQEKKPKRRRKRPERYVDLHVHTNYSDGTKSPTDVVKFASDAKLKAVAITDHDTIDGIPEALAQGTRSRLEVIPGVEIAAASQTGSMDLLGYYIDIASPTLETALRRLRELRAERNPKIIDRLRDMGIEISYDEVLDVAGEASVGRPHIARVLVNKGHAQTVKDAFDRFLGRKAPAYVPKTRLPSAQVISLIREAGGVPVLAHPNTLNAGYGEELDVIVARLVREGLLGIEVMYSGYDPAVVTSLTRIAEKHNIVATGGSDYHGDPGSNLKVGTGTGDLRVPYRFAEALRKASDSLRKRSVQFSSS